MSPDDATTVIIEEVTSTVTVEEELTVTATEERVQVVSVGIVGPPGPMGPEGPPGSAGTAPQAYEHDQAVPSSTWTITHNLGYRPNVTIVDTLDRRVIGDITYTSLNQVTAEFSAAFSGKAYLS